MTIGQDFTDTELTEEEKALLKQSEEGGNYGSYGSAIGTGLGAVGGGIIGGLAGGGVGAVPGAGVGAGLGGGIGSAIGNWLGGDKKSKAESKFNDLRQEDAAPLIKKQAHLRALQQLLGQFDAHGVI